MCRKCEEACPRGAIKAFNFPPRKPKTETAPVASAAAPKAEVPVAKAPVAPKAEAPVVKEAPAPVAPVVEKKVETPKDNETAV